MNHYPIPRDYPEYQSPPEKVSDGRRFSIYAVLDAVFIVVALGLALWLAYILLVGSFVWSVKLVIPLTFGWATLAYLALPRLHQLFTLLYVPNYFIGRTKTVDGILGDPVNLAFDGTDTDVRPHHVTVLVEHHHLLGVRHLIPAGPRVRPVPV